MKKIFFTPLIIILGMLLLIVGCQDQKKREIREGVILSHIQSTNETGITPDSIHIRKVNKQQDSISFYKNKEFLGSATINYD